MKDKIIGYFEEISSDIDAEGYPIVVLNCIKYMEFLNVDKSKLYTSENLNRIKDKKFESGYWMNVETHKKSNFKIF